MSRAVARAATSRRPRAVIPKVVEEGTGEVADDVNALREDVDALLTGAGVQSAEGKKQVADMVKKARSEERAARQARWQGIRADRDADMVKTFAKDAGLSMEHTGSLTDCSLEARSGEAPLSDGHCV